MNRLDLSHPVQAAMAAAIVFVLALAVHRIGRRVVLRLVRGRPVWREVARRTETFNTWHQEFAPVRARWVRVIGLKKSVLHLHRVAVLR